MVNTVAEHTMDSQTGELVYQLVSIAISAVVTVIGAMVRYWVKTSAFAIKYQLDNEATERILQNAVMYAESQSKRVVKNGIEKKQHAMEYIKTVKPELLKTHGDSLNLMIDRKVEQLAIDNKQKAIK